MGFLFLILIGVLIWALARNPLNHPQVKAKIYEINKQWGDFIAGYNRLAKTDAERAITERMLNDLERQGMPVPKTGQPPVTTDATPQPAAVSTEWTAPGSSTPQPARAVAREPLDNTSILLYFGAFLLVAAAGLFVGFGGAAGGVRTFIIAVVAALFYLVGFWLWYDRPKLKQAALTFVGIGIVMAPLAGVAAYSYVFHESGALVWLVTSAACLALYAHALSVLKHPLLEYVLIGAFVSLFESSIAVLTLPAYYYAWGLAAAGLVVQAVQITRKQPLMTDAPFALSANILLPLSIFVSLNMVADHGTLQLAVALLLAAMYYGVMGWQSTERLRLQSLIAAESLFLASAVFFAHSIHHDFADSAVALIVFAVPQLALLAMRPRTDMTSRMGTVLLSSLSFGVLVSQHSEKTALAAFATLAVAAAFVWWRHRKVSGYTIAIISAIGAVLTGVYRLWMPSDLGFTASVIVLGLVAAQILTFYAIRSRSVDNPVWRMWFQAMIVFSAMVGLITILTGSGGLVELPVQLIVYAVALALLWTPLILHDSPGLWVAAAGLTPIIPLVFLMMGYGPFNRPGLAVAVGVGALVWNGFLSGWRQAEQNRAFASGLLLLLPITVAASAPSLQSAAFYTGAYTFSVALLLVARFAALSRDEKRGGLSYMVVASMAAVLALSIAPFAHDRLLSATTALSIGILVVVAARFIENLPRLMAILPFIVQIGLWSTYIDGQLVLYVTASALISALGYYLYATSLNQIPHSAAYYVHYASLATSYIPVMIYVAAAYNWVEVWALPWATLLAAVTTFHAAWKREQTVREVAGGGVIIALIFLLDFYDIRNIQVYAHIIAALFAVYAYWRWRRGEHATSDQYVIAMLLTVTVPLILQALGGVAGDLYGWWLLIEQVAIMLLGMVLKKKLMIRWGLYVALGAVLYQLRGLGWAALAVLAAFLIGLALFRLQRSDHTEPPKTN